MNNSNAVQIMTSGLTGMVNPPNVGGQGLPGSGCTV